MNTIFIIVIILTSITVSNFISKLIPNVSSSIINIVVGFLIGFIPWINSSFANFNSELFMVVILAPLLFIDGQKTPMVNIGSNLKNIISNSVILVILSASILTISIHFLFNINWGLSLIIAAIATPTDATGFNAVVQNRQVDSKAKSRLSHEAMFNDASGMILLQAGTIWLSTGKLSFDTNFNSFLTMTFGGIVVGLILGNLVIIFRQIMMRSNRNVYSSQSLLYFLTPLLIYLIAESLNTSGIIAVVVAGLIHNSESNRSRFISSRQTTFILQSISFISEILNSIVFLILGIYLMKIITAPIYNFNEVILWILIGIFVYITLIVLRFIYLDPREKLSRKAIFSLGGVHGTVTLAMVFSINRTIMTDRLFVGLLISEITIILLSFLIPIIFFKFILLQNSNSSCADQKLNLIRTRAIQEGIDKINNENSSPEIKEMVLYDLRDQNKDNSIKNFLQQYHQFGFNGTHLDDLKSTERQNLMIVAFNAELSYLDALKRKNFNDIQYINEVYSEILYSEILILDPEKRLI